MSRRKKRNMGKRSDIKWIMIMRTSSKGEDF